MTLPNITAIIPSYNRAKELQVTLPSYIENKLIKKIIIVNNGSTDNSSEVIRSFLNYSTEIVEIVVPNRVGAPRARIIGIQNSDTEYILLGEDDVYLASNYTDVLCKQMNEYSCDIISGKIIDVRVKHGDVVDKITSDIEINNCLGFPHDFPPFKVLNANFSSGSPIPVPYSHIIVLAKREIFNKCTFDPWYSSGNGYREDTDFLLSARKLGYKLYFSQDTACYHLRGIMSHVGGQRVNRGLVEFWAAYNTFYMLKKHWTLLSNDFNLNTSPFFTTLMYIWSRLHGYTKRFLVQS